MQKEAMKQKVDFIERQETVIGNNFIFISIFIDVEDFKHTPQYLKDQLGVFQMKAINPVEIITNTSRYLSLLSQILGRRIKAF